jgi:hypothetical protein
MCLPLRFGTERSGILGAVFHFSIQRDQLHMNTDICPYALFTAEMSEQCCKSAVTEQTCPGDMFMMSSMSLVYPL